MISSLCSSCGARIWWAIMPKGRRMPLDPPGAHPEPNLSAWRDHAGILRTGGSAPIGVPVHETTSHFATCPDAGKHRRRK